MKVDELIDDVLLLMGENPGLLDFRLLARIGKAWTMVDFTGGRSSGYGIRWASLTTDDPVLQVLIESSKEFRDQKIIKQSL